MKEKIGANAGLVWSALSEMGGKAELKDIKKATKLTEKDLYAAFGWLSREDKVDMEAVGKDVFVSLV